MYVSLFFFCLFFIELIHACSVVSLIVIAAIAHRNIEKLPVHLLAQRK